MGSFWDRFKEIEARAADTVDGKCFLATGYRLYANGGNCTAWRKDIGRGRFILVTDSEGCTHDLAGEDDYYLVGAHGDDGWHSESTLERKTAIEVIAICAEIAADFNR